VAEDLSGAGAAGQDRAVLRRGKDNTEVAAELRVTESVMARWRRRFTERRCHGLTDGPSVTSAKICLMVTR